MKKVVVILAVVCMVLALVLFRANREFGSTMQRARADLSSASNRVAELELKLNHQERLVAALASQLTNCTENLNQRTADLERTRANLGQADADHKATEARLEMAMQTRRQLETQRHELRERNHDLESGLQHANQRVQSLVQELERLANRHNQASLALAETHAKLEQLRASLFKDPTMLRAQPSGLTPPQRVTSPKTWTAPPPPQSVPRRLQLFPDGTVQVAE